jgi:hypothetical protein
MNKISIFCHYLEKSRSIQSILKKWYMMDEKQYVNKYYTHTDSR